MAAYRIPRAGGWWASYQKAAAPAAPAAAKAPGAPRQPWEALPIPEGTYDPQRDVNIEEAGRGLEQAEGGYATTRERATGDYAQRQQQIGQREGNQQADYETARKQLGEAFQRLAGRQGEAANAAGVLSGGALLQAAAKRAANQGREQDLKDTARQRQRDANTEELAIGDRNLGRTLSDVTTEELNAQNNNAAFGKNEGKLKGIEAARNGYEPPSAPPPASQSTHAVAARTAPGPGRQWVQAPRFSVGIRSRVF